jgi:hypothetical protein
MRWRVDGATSASRGCVVAPMTLTHTLSMPAVTDGGESFSSPLFPLAPFLHPRHATSHLGTQHVVLRSVLPRALSQNRGIYGTPARKPLILTNRSHTHPITFRSCFPCLSVLVCGHRARRWWVKTARSRATRVRRSRLHVQKEHNGFSLQRQLWEPARPHTSGRQRHEIPKEVHCLVSTPTLASSSPSHLLKTVPAVSCVWHTHMIVLHRIVACARALLHHACRMPFECEVNPASKIFAQIRKFCDSLNLHAHEFHHRCRRHSSSS